MDFLKAFCSTNSLFLFHPVPKDVFRSLALKGFYHFYAGASAATWAGQLVTRASYHSSSDPRWRNKLFHSAVVEKLLGSISQEKQRNGNSHCLEVVEIGFGDGHTTHHLLSRVPCLKLHSIDIKIRKRSKGLLRRKHKNQSIFWEMTSEKAAERISNPVDLVFVDGGHFYEDVSLDLRLYWPKILPGGIMAGHDYNAPNPGVVQAVNEFASAKNLSLHLSVDFMWWLYVPASGKVEEKIKLPAGRSC